MTLNNKNKAVPLIVDKAHGAYLGAAIGDALGWPNERQPRRKSSGHTGKDHDFIRWTRRSGGRFYSHEETIEPGDYSDDTQLILATSRSLLTTREWWKHLSYREIPFWTIYERGGGGATKRAANSWLLSRPPWSAENKHNNVRRYFEAGGNGVAMRILPHCLTGVASGRFSSISQQIVANGVITHGHPRALVGALAYGFALWRAFTHKGTLEYGALIEITLQNEKEWGELPDVSGTCPGWIEAAQTWAKGNYTDIWKNTVKEVTEMLHKCRDALMQGALAVDRQVMEQIGAYDRRINGAGTVASAAAIFLSSRYAADPIHGIIDAAFAQGTDTDTIASMTGALLGAVCGSSWLGPYAEKIQDANYLRQIAERIANKDDNVEEKNLATETAITPVKKSDLDSFVSKLQQTRVDDTIVLPDSREAKVSKSYAHKVWVKNVEVVSWQLTTFDGQSLFIKKISRKQQPTQENLWKSADEKSDKSENNRKLKDVTRLGIKLPVDNIDKAREFYNRILGLRIVRETRNIVNLEGIIALVPKDYGKESIDNETFGEVRHSILYIETRNFERVVGAVQKSGNRIITPVTQWGGQKFFRCIDPDGNIVEVFDASYRPDKNDV